MAIAPAPQIAGTTSDDRLARLAAGGSDAAFEAIFARHREPLLRYCHSIVGNEHDAADAVQNTMLRALRALPGDTRAIALRPWLYRIAHNEAISVLRARRNDSDLDRIEGHADHAASSALELRERVRALTDDLSVLTEQQRSALLMRELAGLEYDELAQALGISATAARQAVYDARQGLDALAEGRSMCCHAVRAMIAGGDRRMLRGLKIRSHLRSCASCAGAWAALRPARDRAAAIVPWPLLGAVGAWLRRLLPGSAGATAASGGGVLTGCIAATLATIMAVGGAISALGDDRVRGGRAVARSQLAPAAGRGARAPAPAAGRRARLPFADAARRGAGEPPASHPPAAGARAAGMPREHDGAGTASATETTVTATAPNGGGRRRAARAPQAGARGGARRRAAAGRGAAGAATAARHRRTAQHAATAAGGRDGADRRHHPQPASAQQRPRSAAPGAAAAAPAVPPGPPAAPADPPAAAAPAPAEGRPRDGAPAQSAGRAS